MRQPLDHTAQELRSQATNVIDLGQEPAIVEIPLGLRIAQRTMESRRMGHRAVTDTVLTIAMLVLVLVAATCCYYIFTYPRQNSSPQTHTSTSIQPTASTTLLTSSTTTTSATPSTSPSTSSSSSQSLARSTSTSASSSESSTSTGGFVLPPGGSEIIIPPGIQDANASQLNISFEPNDLVVQVGVNNTIYFVNTDLKYNFGFDIESIAWPTGGQTFAFTILPGRVINVTLTTPGTYRYDCEMHPVWTIGTITVLPANTQAHPSLSFISPSEQ